MAAFKVFEETNERKPTARQRLYLMWLFVRMFKVACSSFASTSHYIDQFREQMYSMGGPYQEKSDPAMRREIRQVVREVIRGH